MKSEIIKTYSSGNVCMELRQSVNHKGIKSFYYPYVTFTNAKDGSLGKKNAFSKEELKDMYMVLTLVLAGNVNVEDRREE